MTTGTEGNDVNLANDPNVLHETVDALGGDDGIILTKPNGANTSTEATIVVHGGAGTDGLGVYIPDFWFRNVNGTGYGGSLTVSYGAGRSYDLSWDSIESLGLTGRLEAGTNIVTGDSADGLNIRGGSGLHVIETNGGDDQINVDLAGFTDLTIRAGSGNDHLTIGGSFLGTVDHAYGGDGNDIIEGSNSSDQLLGDAGNDLLVGNEGTDFLTGGAGADTMRGGYFPGFGTDPSNDWVDYSLEDGPGGVIVNLSTFYPTVGGTQLDPFRGRDTYGDIDSIFGIESAKGTPRDDYFFASTAVNLFEGGAGNDVFLFYASMTGADAVDGGSGTDQLVLQGDYSGGKALTLGTGVVSVENIAILPGDDTRFGDPGTNFYDYNITTLDVNVAAGVQLVVDANRLRVGEDFTFNGSAESDGSFFIYGGGGTDTLTGGANNDVFLFGAQGQWGASDVVNGGSGGIDQLALRGNYTLTFGAGQLIGIENIGLLSAHDTRFGALGSSYSYDLTMVDANVASGVQMTVDGAKLRVAEHFRFDGSQESNGSFKVFGGLVDDTIIGSQNGDFIQGNGGLDTLTGGGGADIFRYLATSDSTTGTVDRILDFTPGTDKIDLTRIDADSFAAGDQAFHWIGSNAFGATGAASAGELRAYQNGGSWFVEGDVNGDGIADLVIELVLQGPVPLGAGDFLP